MAVIVTGVGPRCGTSAMMKHLVDSGLELFGERYPAHGVKEENPEGYFEVPLKFLMDKTHFFLDKKQCIKLFPPALPQLDESSIDLVIVMHRKDKEAQKESIKRVGEKEGYFLTEENITAMLDKCAQTLIPFLRKHPHVYIETNDVEQALEHPTVRAVLPTAGV